MQIKFLSVGLIALAATLVAADTVKVSDTNVGAHNTGSCLLNNLKVEDVLNNLNVNVASKKRSVLSRRKVARTVSHMHHHRHNRRSENERDEEEEDEDEADENENERDEEEEDENENEADEEEADENEVDESSASKAMRRREWEQDEDEDEDEVDEQTVSKLSKRDLASGLLGGGGLLGSGCEANTAGTASSSGGLTDGLTDALI
ncbi:uncharacterized protein ATC70_005811 [Mucor velutinosus]|uniref:Uncharacterized protein n=1 Tax=Mucor velutinosus TaxID=708070 RepID=A0AAN7DDF7_9FUNG|nr:hypothetical protein ATC70_005811 [Mucor velutinosus]